MNHRFLIAAGMMMALFAGRVRATPVTVSVVAAEGGHAVGGATIAKIEDLRVGGTVVAGTIPKVLGVSNADGRVQLDCDPAERSAFLVTADGMTPATFGFWGCVPADYRLTLNKAEGSASGRIVAAGGKAIGGSKVRVYFTDYQLLEAVKVFSWPSPPFPLEARTDSAGRFSMPMPQAHAEAVEVEQPDGWHAAAGEAIGVDATEQSLRDGTFVGRAAPTPLPEGEPQRSPTTRPSLTIHLRVLDAVTNQPIPHVRVSPGGAVSPDQLRRTFFRSTLDLPGDDVTWSFYDGAWAYFLRAEADGYAAAPTRLIKSSESQVNVELKLTKAAPVALNVRLPDGKPAAAAKAYLATPTITLSVPLSAPTVDDAEPIVVAGNDGVVHFTQPNEPYRLAIVHRDGSAEVDAVKGDQATVTLEPWASLSVSVGSVDHPAVGAMLEPQSAFSEGANCPINWGGYWYTDSAGRAVISHFRPGQMLLYVGAPAENKVTWRDVEAQARLKPGEHADWSLMSGKTTVRASMMEYPGYRWPGLWIQPSGPAVDLPPGANQLPSKQRREVVRTAQQKAPNADATESVLSIIQLMPSESGSITVAGLQPGTYVLGGYASRVAPSAGEAPATQPAQPPSLNWYFSVPTSQPAEVDLGTVAPPAADAPALQVGQRVSDLKTTALNGKPFDLRACRGKWVLLDFWGTWCGFCIAEEPSLKDAYEGWARDGRLMMVSASVDDTEAQVRKHVAEKQLPWTQLVLGPREKTDIPQKFAVDGYPTILLISPEGKLVESGLRGARIRELLLKDLGPAAPPPASK